jgi:hypothetical protein
LSGKNFEEHLICLRQELASAPPDPYPHWGDGMSAILNALARSATFSPIEKGARGSVINYVIPAQAGYEIIFTGEQLDEGDRDLYLNLTRLYTGINPGSSCNVSIRTLLKGIRSYGKPNREWLFNSLKRLADIKVDIKFDTPRFSGFYKGYIFSILAIAEKDEGDTGGSIVFSIPPEFMRIFIMSKDYTKIPINKRLTLKGPGSQLAKWLHSYLYSHKTPFPVKVETIKKLSGSQTKELRDFRAKLKHALDLLEKNGDITAWEIEATTDLVHMFRDNKDKNQLYIKGI